MEAIIRGHFTSIHDEMIRKGYNESVLHEFEHYGEAGIYLLRCCDLPNSQMRVYKPGITGTNINLIEGKGITPELKNDYISVMSSHFKKHYKKPSDNKKIETIEKQFSSRNGKIKDGNKGTHITSAYESKEDYLPVIFRFKTSIFIAWLFENIITLINSSSITFINEEDRLKKINPNDMKYFCYNGYALKALYPSKSGNRNESVIFGLDYENKFLKLMMTCFKSAERLPVLTNEDNINKMKIYAEYHKQFKEMECVAFKFETDFSKVDDFEIPAVSNKVCSKNGTEQKSKLSLLLGKYRKYINFDVVYGVKVDYSKTIEDTIKLRERYNFIINTMVLDEKTGKMRHYTFAEVAKMENGVELLINGVIQDKWSIENGKIVWLNY